MARTVLICNGTRFMRTRLARIFREVDLEVVGESGDGAEAVARHCELHPDLVTMDVVMPELDGLGAVGAIVEEDPEARILMCSAMGQQPLMVEAIRAGARESVVKPFRPSRLLEAGERVLG